MLLYINMPPKFFNTTPEKTKQQIEAINKHLNFNFKRTTSQFDRLDAVDVDKKAVLECKRRTCLASSHPDTLIGINKYNCWKKKYPNYDFYATFLFEDGLYYYKFDKDKSIEEQNLFTTKNKKDKDYNEHTNYEKEHINIPIQLLTPLGDYPKLMPPIQKGVCYLKFD
jgi:hypothetical protein